MYVISRKVLASILVNYLLGPGLRFFFSFDMRISVYMPVSPFNDFANQQYGQIKLIKID